MTDILGPANAQNAVTVRPSDTRSGFGGSDTWFKDCTSSTAVDGTDIQAGWLNKVTAVLRSAIRMNGNTGAALPVVTENDTDDALLLKAISQFIQRGQAIYADDAGPTSNSIVVALSPVPPEYKKGMSLSTKLAHDVTAATVVNVNGLGSKSVMCGGLALSAGIAKAGDIVTLEYDGATFQLTAGGRFGPNARPKLTTGLTIYCSPTGSDLNDGLSPATAFQTLNKAFSYAQSLDLNGLIVTVSCAAGSYDPLSASGNVSGSVGAAGIVFLASGVATISQSSTSGFAALAFSNAALSFSGPWIFTCPNITGGNGACISAQTNGQILLSSGGIQFGAAATGAHISASSGGIIIRGGSYTIQNITAARHLYASGGQIVSSGTAITVTLSGSPAFTVAFAEADGGAAFISELAVSYSGTAVGQRYQVSEYAWIQTYGGGVNFYPGSGAGVVSAGTYS